MQRKAFLTFIVMSAVLMGGYLLCLAGSGPWWAPVESDSDTGTIYDDDNECTLYCNTYVASNYIGSGPYTFRTYHWARVARNGAGLISFWRTWTHCQVSDSDTQYKGDEVSPWEVDNYWTTTKSGGVEIRSYTIIQEPDLGNSVESAIETQLPQ